MSRETEFVVEPFTNALGQTMQPGDTVLYAGTSWKNTSIDKAVFDGVNKWKGSVVSVRVSGITSRWWVWDKVTQKGEYRNVLRTATLPLKRIYKWVE